MAVSTLRLSNEKAPEFLMRLVTLGVVFVAEEQYDGDIIVKFGGGF